MKTKECIQCEKFFECPGKVNDKPCLHFKNRKGNKDEKNRFNRSEIWKINSN